MHFLHFNQYLHTVQVEFKIVIHFLFVSFLQTHIQINILLTSQMGEKREENPG